MFRNVLKGNLRWCIPIVCVAVMIAGVSIAQTPPLQGDSESESASVEAQVRASFETQMKLQARRIELAEQKLAKIKQRYSDRMENAEQLIAQQVATLMEEKLSSEAATDDAAVAKMPDKKLSTNELDDQPASVLSAKGWQLWRQRDLDGALTAFKTAAAKSQTDANIYNGLGWTLCNMGKFEEAIDAFEKALKIEPQHGAAINGIGQSYRGLGRLDDAEKTLMKATEALIEQFGEETVVRQEMTASWISLIDVAIERKNWDLAIQWAKRYLEHKPGDERVKAALKKALANKQ
jgi:tetratricopeptide (TPR) repeat protein